MNTINIAGIGTSAGGLQSLYAFFDNIPHNTGISFIVVQHLAIDYDTRLHHLIEGHTWMPVHLLTQNQIPLPDNIYVLPGHLRVTIKDGQLVLTKRSTKEVINNAIDQFLVSLASDQKERAIAIIFSGMGTDGSLGVEAVARNKGLVLVQDPDSTEYKVMPTSAISADHPEKILQPSELGKFLSKKFFYNHVIND